MKLGFIGLGRMGSAMAANLIRAGHEVTVFNRTPGKSSALGTSHRLQSRSRARHIVDARQGSAR